jgi:hypothetical protein
VVFYERTSISGYPAAADLEGARRVSENKKDGDEL